MAIALHLGLAEPPPHGRDPRRETELRAYADTSRARPTPNVYTGNYREFCCTAQSFHGRGGSANPILVSSLAPLRRGRLRNSYLAVMSGGGRECRRGGVRALPGAGGNAGARLSVCSFGELTTPRFQLRVDNSVTDGDQATSTNHSPALCLQLGSPAGRGSKDRYEQHPPDCASNEL